jgi:hypothetical protein
MTTLETVPVPSGVALSSAGPIMRDGSVLFVSPRDLPILVRVDTRHGPRAEIAFHLGYRDSDSAQESLADVEGFDAPDDAGTVMMSLAFARERRRVAWVKAFGVNLDADGAVEHIRSLLQSMRQRIGALPASAQATLDLLYRMVPAFVAHHSEQARRKGSAGPS